MEKGYKALKINLEDIKKFLKEASGFGEIDSIHMGLLINEKEKYGEKIGSLPKDKKYLTVQSNENKTIDKLAILFYRYGHNYGDKCKPIMYKSLYESLTLILRKDSKGELYFENNNCHTRIQVEAAKKNEFAFGNIIFFGDRIDHLIYTIFKNNEKFIDFNDAKNSFDIVSCIRDRNGWHINTCSRDINRYCGFDLMSEVHSVIETEKIYEIKIFIGHNNYENIRSNDLSNDTDINALRKKGYVEIDLKENDDTTGFKYKLTDCNGRLISYAVDHQYETESSRLNDYLNSRYEHGELKNFVERFNLGLNNISIVLSDKAQGIYLTDHHVMSADLICLGDNTKLIFTKEFLDQLQEEEEEEEEPGNKFYVRPKSQALQDILNFIAETKLVPCKKLFFINEKIVKSYDINKDIIDNIDEKCIPKLCIDDFNLIKVNKNNFEYAFRVPRKVKDPIRNFGKNGIYEMLTQAIKNAEREKERKISGLEIVVEGFLALSMRNPNNQNIKTMYEEMKEKLKEEKNRYPNNQSIKTVDEDIKTVYEKMKEKLEEEKNRYPNQESQANYEK